MDAFDGPTSTPKKKKGRVIPTMIRRSPRLFLKTKLNKFTSKEPVVLSDDDEPPIEPHSEPLLEPQSQIVPH